MVDQTRTPLISCPQVLGILDRGGARAVLVQRSTERNQARLQRLVSHLAQHCFMFRIDVSQFWQVGGHWLSAKGCAVTCYRRRHTHATGYSLHRDVVPTHVLQKPSP